METEIRQVRYNPMKITSLMAFGNLRGGWHQGVRQVYFVRCIGYDENYLENISKLDEMLTRRIGEGVDGYSRIGRLWQLTSHEDIAFYTESHKVWKENGGKGLFLKNAGRDSALCSAAGEALFRAGDLFRSCTPNGSESIERNFMIKLLYWTDQVIPLLCREWKREGNYKLSVCGAQKKQEYLFCIFLTLLGVDVLILSPEKEVDAEEALLDLSHKLELEKKGKIVIPEYRGNQKAVERPAPAQASPASERPAPAQASPASERPAPAQASPASECPAPAKLIIPPRSSREPKNRLQPMTMAASLEEREKTFEELALLASSIVMISILDNRNKVIGSGSGIMVGPEGYILTNNHVASGGAGYLVRIEDDEKVYQTGEVIKYHSILDLALIRIDRRLTPLPIYIGEKKLVRGQRVVAIGSPLGFFNSVSDGIISGFRKIQDVDMIQFTAPISHGSSGGALLNMYGEVIGISTAGVDNGQNINLAVEYRDIYAFVRGFL